MSNPTAFDRAFSVVYDFWDELTKAVWEPPVTNCGDSSDDKAEFMKLPKLLKLGGMAQCDGAVAMVLDHKIATLADVSKLWPADQLDVEIIGVLRDNKFTALEKVMTERARALAIDIGPLPPQRHKKPRHGPKP